MPYQDFRQFLDVLRRHGELIDIESKCGVYWVVRLRGR
jgi:3-polyprenyl-4-hydroxybenzoate decarboxylase